MFWILNHKIDSNTTQGIISLLDFIFSEKRAEEREEYRIVRLEEEEKEKSLAKIQDKEVKEVDQDVVTTKKDELSPRKTTVSDDSDGDKKKAVKGAKQKLSKKEIKQ